MEYYTKKVLSVVLALTFILSAIPMTGVADLVKGIDWSFLAVKSKAASNEDLVFVLNEDGESYTVKTANTLISGELVIPSEYNNKPVNRIADEAFMKCEYLTSVDIPDSVFYLGKQAFFGCSNLEDIDVPNNLIEIGYLVLLGTAFYNNINNWENGVLYLGNYLFNTKDSIAQSYTVKCGTSVIAQQAFSGNTTICNVVLSDTIKYICAGAFIDCSSLSTINLPDGLISIGNGAFINCGLTSISIPESVKMIGYNQFNECNYLTDFVVNYNPECSYLHLKDKITKLVFSKNVTVIPQYAFEKYSKLKEVVIMDGVKAIEKSAFLDCTSLSTITLPESISSFGTSAFYNTAYYNNESNWQDGELLINDVLISVKKTVSGTVFLGSDIRIIAGGAFLGCSNITSIIVPDSVLYINEYAFRECESLSSISLSKNVECLENGAFYRCTNLSSISIPNSISKFEKSAFYCCEKLKSVYIDDLENWCGVEFEDKYSNPLCNEAKLYIKGNLTTNIEFSQEIQSIGDYTFCGCSSLVNVAFSNNNIDIGNYSFYYCTSLKQVTGSENIVNIGSFAFYYCYSLSSFTFSNNIITIGDSAFYSCLIKSVVLSDTLQALGSNVFGSYPSSLLVYYNPNCSYEGIKDNITDVVFNSDTTAISEYSFFDCKRLQSVTIPDTVTEIGEYSFFSIESSTGNLIPNLDVTIYCYEGSYAREYAIQNGFTDFILCKHDYVATVIEPTCRDKGYTVHECSHCFDSYIDSYTDFVSHKYSTDWTIDVKPTCTEMGNKSRHCIWCNEKTDVTTIPTVQHSLKLEAAEVSATCTTTGKTAIYKCENCTYTEGGVTISMVAHNYSTDWTVDTPATCTIEGSKSHHCLNCTAKKDVTAIVKAAHSLKLQTAEIPATCTTTGKTAIYKCENCTYTEGGAIMPIMAHDYSVEWTVDVENTCTTDGSKSRHCNNCSAKTDVTILPAKGHIYKNGVCSCGDWQYKNTVLELGKVTNQNGSVKLTWNAVTGATGYIVYRKVGSATSWSKLATVTTFTYTDKNVKTGTKYIYTVRAVCGSINGQYNKTGIATYYVAQPTVKVANQNGSVKASWAKVAGAKNYIVYRKAGSATSWTKVATVTTNAYTDKSVKSGTNYTYTVKAVNGSYVSAYNTKGVVTKYLAQPTLGTPVSAKAGVTVKWGKVTGASGYIVYRKTGSGSYAKIATVKGNAKVSYLDKSAKKGTSYTYTVRAYYSSYYSAYNTKGVSIKDKY